MRLLGGLDFAGYPALHARDLVGMHNAPLGGLVHRGSENAAGGLDGFGVRCGLELFSQCLYAACRGAVALRAGRRSADIFFG